MAVAVSCREERQSGQRPGGELHGRCDPEHDARREGAPTLRQHHGEEEEGRHGDVVASGRQGQRRQREDDEGLQGADLAPPVRTAEVERHRRHHERRQAEEDPGVAQPVVGPDLARYSRHRHEGQIGQEPREVGLAGGVVLHRVRELDERVVGVLAPEEVLAADLDGDHLWLLVGARDTVEAPEDLEPQRNGEATGEHADGDHDPGQPGPPVLHSRQGVAGLPLPGAPHQPCQHGRCQGAEGERRERHPSPDLVERVGRRVDRQEGEQCAGTVQQRVAGFRRDPVRLVQDPLPDQTGQVGIVVGIRRHGVSKASHTGETEGGLPG